MPGIIVGVAGGGLVYFKKIYKIGIVAFSFVFDKYCPIID